MCCIGVCTEDLNLSCDEGVMTIKAERKECLHEAANQTVRFQPTVCFSYV
jgi:HSP20 family molecular chaperone IbpA